jgi:hypothetical protein
MPDGLAAIPNDQLAPKDIEQKQTQGDAFQVVRIREGGKTLRTAKSPGSTPYVPKNTLSTWPAMCASNMPTMMTRRQPNAPT